MRMITFIYCNSCFVASFRNSDGIMNIIIHVGLCRHVFTALLLPSQVYVNSNLYRVRISSV